jgi:small ligand-binding sensory domain FIST
MRFAAALSTQADTARAVEELCRDALAQLDGPADLAALFVSHQHGPEFDSLVGDIYQRIQPRALIGCTGESIVGVGREIEGAPAMALWLARLPNVRIVPFQLRFARTAEGGTFLGWPDELAAPWPAGAALLLLGEPFTFPADVLLERLNEDQPGVKVLGGMASGGWNPGQNRLFLNGLALEEGAVGAWLCGAVRVGSIVSQGCRPVGRPFVITKAERNVILELAGRPAMERLQEVFNDLSAEDQQRLRQGLHVGRVINEYQDRFGRGDFLIRNVIGADPNSGAIAVGDYVRAGQTVQFHLRDARTADEDLRELTGALKTDVGGQKVGALLFTCNGRGTRLFPEPHHDAAVLEEAFGSLPCAGLFAQGEIGPVGDKNFLHGFTASVALFTEQS